jgi:integrase
MARQGFKLSAKKVENLSKVGWHSDGNGLYLRVTSTGKKWVFVFFIDGKRKELGLGTPLTVSLEKVREEADKARKQVKEGKNPIEERELIKQERLIENAMPSFGDIADKYLMTKQAEFRNEKHIAQWKMTLNEYAKPIRNKPVNLIDTDDILSVLKPIWLEKPETASRLRGRLEKVLDAAKAQGFRTGENPAFWRGHLEFSLAKRQKLTRGHHAALPFDDVPKLIEKLHAKPSLSALGLELCILTATRTGEILNMEWSEIDLEKALWLIPAKRMKMGKEHRVPLTQRCLLILETIYLFTGAEREGYVFKGARQGRPLSGMALAMCLRGYDDKVTVHGFRSSFRDWAGEVSHFSREVAEAALAHSIGDATERAYRRGDALEKRRELMKEWESHCLPKPSTDNVLEFKRA